ncbi:cupin domain-containing protein [Sagittula sp. S175]|uniref:cupin domain-containing protein n=1 Tax=Sagittula sp. S175 TaxID=3415129 RepID=UPI003C7BCD31
MRLRADFSKREVVRPEDYDWRASPASGVSRMMLDRIGEEVARATTIVRFDPDSAFDAHTHGGGEEYLVLEGVFSDEHGDYPAGTYVRNPIGTRHRPHIGPEGATILVKLCQFAEDDQAQFAIDTRKAVFHPGQLSGVSELQLHRVPGEEVRMIRLQPGAELGHHVHHGGAELLVLEGTLEDESGSYPAGTWVRLPQGDAHTPRTSEGCLLWIKTGHLRA